VLRSCLLLSFSFGSWRRWGFSRTPSFCRRVSTFCALVFFFFFFPLSSPSLRRCFGVSALLFAREFFMLFPFFLFSVRLSIYTTVFVFEAGEAGGELPICEFPFPSATTPRSPPPLRSSLYFRVLVKVPPRFPRRIPFFH